MAIPRETWAYVTILGVVLLGAIMREINLLIIMAGLMAGPLLISWQMIRATLRNLEVTRNLPGAVFPGERLSVDLRLKNCRRRLDSWAIVIEDLIQLDDSRRQSPATWAQALLPHLAAGGEERVEYCCRLWQRGRYRVGPLRLKTRVPLGLLQGHVTVEQLEEFLVYPRLGQLSGRWLQLAKVERSGQHSSRRHPGPIEGDFYGLRDWRPGDSPRWIHWRSSAKRNSLLVRQFEQHRSQDFIVLLDLWPGTSPRLQPTKLAEVVERAISFAATVCAEHCRRGTGNLIVGVAGKDVRQLRAPASSALLSDVLQLLAEAQESPTDQFPELLGEVLPTVALDDRVVIVSLRATNLQNSLRLDESLQDTRPQQVLSQALMVDAAASDFADLFSWEAVDA